MTSKDLLQCIFIISLAATLGSLYYGYFWDPLANILSGDLFNRQNGFPACDMCRYIRIFQFPIPILTWIALLRKDYNIVNYVAPIAFLGIIVSLYKYSLEMGWIVDKWLCGINSAASCSSTPIMYRGFLTLAFLWITSFGMILIISRIIKKRISSPVVH